MTQVKCFMTQQNSILAKCLIRFRFFLEATNIIDYLFLIEYQKGGIDGYLGKTETAAREW